VGLLTALTLFCSNLSVHAAAVIRPRSAALPISQFIQNPDAGKLLTYAFGSELLSFITSSTSTIEFGSAIKINASAIPDLAQIVSGNSSITEKTLQFVNVAGLAPLLPNCSVIKGTLQVSAAVAVDSTLLLYYPNVTAAAAVRLDFLVAPS
jgi:hypothetical protein